MSIRSRRQQPFIWVDLALDDFGLGVDAFRVYVHLCRRAGKDGNAFPSYASIGEHCFRGDSPNAKPESLRRRAMRAIQELIEKGLIEREGRSGKGGEYTSNNYWINDLKDIPSDLQSPPLVTDNHHPSDLQSPPLVTDNHHPSDLQSPAYIEVDPLKQIHIEVDPDKHPPTPQRGDESEPAIIAELILEDPEDSIEPSPTTGPTPNNPPLASKDPGEARSSAALVPVDPFLARRSSLSYQQEKALAESLVGSPFQSIKEQDEFYSQYWEYIRATSDHLNLGQVTGIAQSGLNKIMAGTPSPEHRRILDLWKSGQLKEFRGLELSREAIDREKRRATSLEILETTRNGGDLYGEYL